MALGTTDISVSLIKATLGESSNKISELCKSSKINKWSKFKPVGLSSSQIFNLSNLSQVMKAADCGFSFELFNNIMDCYNSAVDLGLNADTWLYNKKPNGGENSPYCQGYFRQYDHNAVKPFVFDMSNAIDINTGEKIYYSDIAFSLGRVDNNPLQLSDFNTFANLRVGIVVCQRGTTNIEIITSEGIPPDTLFPGYYSACIFIAQYINITKTNVSTPCYHIPSPLIEFRVLLGRNGLIITMLNSNVTVNGIGISIFVESGDDLQTISQAEAHFRFTDNVWLDSAGQWRVNDPTQDVNLPQYTEEDTPLPELNGFPTGSNQVIDILFASNYDDNYKSLAVVVISGLKGGTYFGFKLMWP
jgi:hypothetical protein